MEVRAELKYTKSHEWVKEEGGVWTIGLTDYAQSALGDLVFVNLPEAGDSVEAGEVFGDVESALTSMILISFSFQLPVAFSKHSLSLFLRPTC